MRAVEGVEDPNPITGRPFYIRAYDHKSIQPLYLVEWTKSETANLPPYYWKVIAKLPNPEQAHLPDEYSAHYDQMQYG